MADSISPVATAPTVAESNAHRTPEQLRRLAHDRFVSPKTQEAISDAAYNVPGTNVFDHQRILEQLAERLNDYLSIPHFKAFRQSVGRFVTRQAQLSAKLRALMPELATVASSVPGCGGFGHVATMVFRRTPEFTGDVEDTDALKAWATEVVKLEAEAVVAFAGWLEDHQRAVLSGVWEVLTTSLDLGIEGVADELAAQVWRWVSLNAVDLMQGDVPIHDRLWNKAYWTARAWKTARLDERAEVGSLDALISHEDGTGMPVPELIDLGAIQNPIVIGDLLPKWTDADVARELRRAGPFRADDAEDALLMAA